MTTLTADSHTLQNVGLWDRMLRVAIGCAMIGFAYYFAAQGSSDLVQWNAYSLLLSVYPMLTGILGWDPFYALFHTKSCHDGGRNQCGTFPYEVKAAMGHAPKVCDMEDEHSLESCHDEGVERPHHEVWRVDRDPMLYPDDGDWKAYFASHKDQQ